jgi:Holliday junction DNA helicase RuvA
MYEFITGKITEITPTFVILECNGTGYFIHISVSTYSQIQSFKEIKLLIHQIIREDAHLLYGFYNKLERDIFRLLISVSGIGANTARMMLSSLTPAEIQQAILTSDVNLLTSIKGVGTKSAQRMILDLKDKLNREATGEEIFVQKDNRIKDEALSALVMLGFSKTAVEKVVHKILSANKDIVVEELIKKALKSL